MKIEQITFGYTPKQPLLHDISCELDIGKVTTIIGPNGCGKSTLLGVMCRHHTPQSGQVIVDGKAISSYKPKQLARKLAVVHQHDDAPADITVEKLAGFGRLPHKSLFAQDHEQDDKAIEWALSCTNLQHKRNMKLDELSGGERQRAWIALALAQSTPILFLDEPTTYLDIYYQIEILELIKSLNTAHQLTIVMVLHDINQAIRYSDNIMVMKDGQVVMQGAPQHVITQETIKSIYGVDVLVKHDQDTGMYIVPTGI
ncbi:ABC transporter ATP-binding protein [Paenibacillus sp. 481]|uniref:ABC transporter ATP-binding protein n=1 Tax=Paenibacillus sp. 481 TaxID=2835869 RepID=UPI001E438F04|nr:ATP-binding cassette domain-containing protein [Paenibacillus sp. 481]UHA74485.1 ABC transporter ATP-binding protein [Paenibacillus sp. 481]